MKHLKLPLQIIVLSLFCWGLLLVSDFMVVNVFAMQVKSVQAESVYTQRQIDTLSSEVKELRVAQEKYWETQQALKVDLAEIKAKFAITYGMLGLIGGTLVVIVIQRYAGERRK